MTIKANINIRALKAAAIACSNEETRFYLKGVFVKTVGPAVRYVATDGHRLIVLRELTAHKPLETPDDIPGVIIPAHVIKALKIEKHTDYAEIVVSGLDFTIRQIHSGTVGKLVDGTFPDYERVFGRGPYKLNSPAQFNADYLADFQKAGNIIEKSTSRIAAVSHNGPENPAFVDFMPTAGPIKGFGIIMPVRVADLAKDVPAWLDGDYPKPAKPQKSVKQNLEAKGADQ